MISLELGKINQILKKTNFSFIVVLFIFSIIK